MKCSNDTCGYVERNANIEDGQKEILIELRKLGLEINSRLDRLEVDVRALYGAAAQAHETLDECHTECTSRTTLTGSFVAARKPRAAAHPDDVSRVSTDLSVFMPPPRQGPSTQGSSTASS